jgi:N-sulfoglucosamine sulfohydrolase
MLRIAITCLILAASALSWRSEATAAEKNVILYVVDDLGSTDAGCYGNPKIKTPGVDALAKSGTRFTHAFCTTASCSPSRSVMLTGLHNHANGQYGLQHANHHFQAFDNVKSLPVMLAAKGYRTASAGKFHVGPEKTFHFPKRINAPSPVEMAEKCREVIAADSDAPFFLYFCTTEPHRNFARGGSDPVKPEAVIVPPYLPDTPACREELAQYYMSAQRADSGLVKLLAILEETGRAKDTLVIFVSDNGIPFPGAKTTLYDPGMRLPCVVRNPYGKKQGVVSDAMLSWVDLTPTILDFTGATPPDAKFHGRSFLCALESEHADGWDEVYGSHTFHEVTMYYPMRVLRTRDYKLIWNIADGLEFPFASDLYGSATWQDTLKSGAEMYGRRRVQDYLKRPKFELYDLRNDPDEVKNLAASREHAELLESMQRKLKEFQKQTGDPWILKWDRE